MTSYLYVNIQYTLHITTFCFPLPPFVSPFYSVSFICNHTCIYVHMYLNHALVKEITSLYTETNDILHIHIYIYVIVCMCEFLCFTLQQCWRRHSSAYRHFRLAHKFFHCVYFKLKNDLTFLSCVHILRFHFPLFANAINLLYDLIQ